MKVFERVLFGFVALLLLVSCATTAPTLLTKEEVCDQLVSYRVIIASGSNALITNTASEICKGITGYVDGKPTNLRVGVDRNADAIREIDFGATARPESSACAEGLGPMDYTIQVLNGGRVVLVGGSSAASAAAGRKFVEMVNDGSFNCLETFEYTYRFFDEHTSDPLCNLNSPEAKALIADWESKYTSPAWGGLNKDLKESLYALTNKYSKGKGRVAMFAHRGDMSHYPENSLAGMISALMSGTDTIEFDFRFTKDFIPVVFHDETLTRMTNWKDMQGTNGLPTSSYIKDWTFDELMQLNMLDYYGNVTEYKIATVYDGLKLAAGKMQISFDDKSSSGVSFDDLYFPLAEATNSYESLILTVRRNGMKTSALKGHISDELISFVDKQGSFTGAYSFYSNATYFAEEFGSNYTSLKEDATTWDHLIYDLGKRYVGSNQCYALSVYMREQGMQPWKY